MYSFAFPNMFKGSKSYLVKDYNATLSNMKLILDTEKGSLFGDPYYGNTLRTVFYEQNNLIIQDLIIDDIFTTLSMFMPQLIISRDDITITSDKTHVYANIKATNRLDYTTNLYQISLISSGEE